MSGKPQRKGLGGKVNGPGTQKPGGADVTKDLAQLTFSTSPPTMEKIIMQEDAIIASLGNTSRTAVASPARPAYSAQGKEVTMKSNFFALTPKGAEVKYYPYSITIDVIPTAADIAKGKTPKEPVGKKVKRIVEILLEQAPSQLVTDFKTTLVTCSELPPRSLEHTICYRTEDEETARVDCQRYRLHLRQHTEFPSLSLRELSSFLNSTEAAVPYVERLPMLQTLNTLLGCPVKASSETVMIGKNKGFAITSDTESKDLGRGLVARRGYFMSARLATGRTLVNVNVTHAAFYKSVGLDKLMQAFGTSNLVALQKFLKGIRISTGHLKDGTGKHVRRIKVISGLANESDVLNIKEDRPTIGGFGAKPTEVSFTVKDPLFGHGKRYTVSEFFKEKHKINVTARYPVVNVGNIGKNGSPIYLPAEACTVVSGQIFQSALSQEQTKTMTTNYAVRFPEFNQKSVEEKGLKTMGLQPNSAQMTAFNMVLDPNMIQVKGRQLLPPDVQYKNIVVNHYRQRWNLDKAKFMRSRSKPIDWATLALYRPGVQNWLEAKIKDAVVAFGKILNRNGVATKEPTEEHLTYTDGKMIEDRLRKLKDGNIEVVLVILPAKEVPLYGLIKRLGEIKFGIHTICVVWKDKFEKHEDQYCANVATKFNLKLGGINHVLGKTDLPIVSDGDTMVVGIDVTHPTASSAEDAPSVAAMVASVDGDLGQWPAVLRVQVQSRLEMVTQAGEMLQTRLDIWKAKHRTLPANILIYRDGVSDGQYQQVLEVELKKMQDACKPVYHEEKKGPPKFTLVIVGKRHHTRFYPEKNTPASDANGNPKSGTLVDRHVTEARNWDFFLQSHKAIQGTARPAHYVVLWDEIFSTCTPSKQSKCTNAADTLHTLTHNMCYLFGRSTSAVSIQPPVYYADIACERTRCYLSSDYEGSETGTWTSDETDAGRDVRRESLRVRMQRDITVHEPLGNSMFYI